MIENFNDRYQQKFLGKVVMASEEDLKAGSLVFEQRHNSRYRYSKLGGKTPLKALAASNTKLRFPDRGRGSKASAEKTGNRQISCGATHPQRFETQYLR